MKVFSLFLVFILLNACVSKDPTKWSDKRIERYEKSIRCVSNKYSIEQQRQMFPFNRAKKVVAIAYSNVAESIFNETPDVTIVTDTVFDSQGNPSERSRPFFITACDSKKVLQKWTIKNIKKFSAEYCATEVITLNQNQIDTLSDMVLDRHLNKPSIQNIRLLCYPIPRNAILFLDDKEEVIAVIQMCLSCYEIIYSFERHTDKTLDCGVGPDLEEFMKNVGIKYGIWR